MATPTVTLKNASDVDYTLTESFSQGSRKVYKDLSRSLFEPRELTTSSEVRGKGASMMTSSLAKLTSTVIDATDNTTTVTGAISMKIETPAKVMTFAAMDELVRSLCKKMADDSTFRGNIIRGSFVA